MSVSTEQMVEWCRNLLVESPDFPPLEACLEVIPPVAKLGSLPAGTRVLVRGDTDVVFDEQGRPDDDSRLRALIETLKCGVERGWVQILYGHRGRKPELSLQPVARYLDGLLKDSGVSVPPIPVIADWMDDSTGAILDAAEAAVKQQPPGAIIMLENTRKYKLEQCLWKAKPEDLPELAGRLCAYANGMHDKLGQVHVNEGFAASNRDLSSTIVPVTMQQNALGSYIDRELRTHLKRTRQAELVVFSGLKIEKLDDLQMILNRGQVRMVIAAGSLAMALKKAAADLAGETFEMGAAGDPSQSTSKIYIPDARIAQARDMITAGRKAGVEFVLPVDFVMGDGTSSETIPPGGAQFDVGPKTIALHAAKIGEFIAWHRQKLAEKKGPAVAFHNGVFGMFEKEEFSQGTRKFMDQLKRMTDAGLEVYVGGGEGGAALHRYGDDGWVTHCFTAGGTILKALGTEPIPYIKALYLACQRQA